MSTHIATPVEPPPLPPIVAALPQLDLTRILLVMQGALGVMVSIETLIVMVATGAPLLLPLLASWGLTAMTLIAAGRLHAMGRRTRRLILALESMWLAGAAIDLGLSLLLTQRGLGLVSTLTRVVTPLAVIGLLTRSPVRAAFGRDA